jgi:hypothetical protein
LKFSRWLWVLFTGVLMGQVVCGAAQAIPASRVVPVKVLVQSPADTETMLQIICLFRLSPSIKLQGSLVEIDEKLHGLLGEIRRPGVFEGDWGETMLVTPPARSLKAKQVLIVGLGDPATFTPERMYLVGKIAMQEANRLGVAHPFFAPTILDGGVSGFPTGVVSEQVRRGFIDAATTIEMLHAKGAGPRLAVIDVTFLAGGAHAADTQSGLDRAVKRP